LATLQKTATLIISFNPEMKLFPSRERTIPPCLALKRGTISRDFRPVHFRSPLNARDLKDHTTCTMFHLRYVSPLDCYWFGLAMELWYGIWVGDAKFLIGMKYGEFSEEFWYGERSSFLVSYETFFSKLSAHYRHTSSSSSSPL